MYARHNMAASNSTPRPPQQKNVFEKALSVFSDVRAGEGTTVLLLSLNAFNMMALYYILKPVREALILSQAGAEVKSYASAAQALLFLAVVPLYGAFAARVNRVWLLSGMTLFFISNLIVFIFLGGAGAEIGVGYYIWLGIFNFMIVSQFWAYANDLYTEEQGKRLFPIIGIGTSFGALIGAKAAGMFFGELGPYHLMTIAGVLLGLFIVLIVVVNRREAGRATGVTNSSEQKLSKDGGFHLVMRSRYLRLIAFLVLMLNLVNTVGEFVLGKLVENTAIAEIGAGKAFEAQRGIFIGEFYGDFFFWVNLAGFLIQTFLVSRLFKKIGVRGSLFILPAISAATYGLTALSPILKVVRPLKMAENSTDYSLNNTVRQALFLPTNREEKYKAKAAIDTFFGRTGDALQALVVFAGTSLAFGIQAFALLNLAFIAVWFAICGGIAREHKRMAAEA